MNDDANPYAAPVHGAAAPVIDAGQGWIYLGFWQRVVASILDNIILGIVGFIIGLAIIFGIGEAAAESLAVDIINMLIGAVIIIGFWIARNATPGKMIYKAEIRDARTFGKPSVGQFIGRYFAYIPSALVLGIGFIWVAFDKRKRGWHDMMAGTVVVRRGAGGVRPATRPVRRAPPPVRTGQRPAEDLPPARGG